MLKRTLIAACAAATLSTGAFAAGQAFDTMKGVEAEPLTAIELDAVQGQISFTELKDAITASKWYAANVAQGNKLILQLTALYERYPKFWDRLLAFIKLPPLN